MNPGFPPPPPPDDEAADPLLRALRQRLGDYGQAPPPGAWAAIRQRVPPPPPPPWWRQGRLLAILGLIICFLRPGTLSEQATLRRAEWAGGVGQSGGAASSASSLTQTTMLGSRTAHFTKTPEDEQVIALKSTAFENAAPLKTSAKPSLSSPHGAANKPTTTMAASRPATPTTGRVVAGHTKSFRQRITASLATRPTSNIRTTAGASRRKTSGLALALAAGRRPPNHWLAARRRRATEPTAPVAPTESSAANLPSGWRARRAYVATKATFPDTNSPAVASTNAARVAARRGSLAPYLGQAPSRSRAANLRLTAPAETVTPATTLADSSTSGVFAFGPVGLLAPKQPGLLLPAVVPLAALVARPDSAPAVLPARRWALLVLAGPTLSYRTLGPAPTLAAGHPDFARLERPALGLGAQVQVRRVLSGRWALAVGLGYHEYATRLALSLKDSAYAAIHQRDTYRLLTVPVQLSYALGVPKSRLSKALLLGAEPGWYLGGRSTEGSGCGCEQQVYTSASSSPYRPLSVAFSLGLDLRYRLGSSGSRWQWLVQPTGRYVATPFVRTDAISFTRRQPFSLGLLTGFSWDVR